MERHSKKSAKKPATSAMRGNYRRNLELLPRLVEENGKTQEGDLERRHTMKRRRKLTKTDQELVKEAREFLSTASAEEVERFNRLVRRWEMIHAKQETEKLIIKTLRAI